MLTLPQCYSCKHLREGRPMQCDAFPQGIPQQILLNKFDHRKPFEGDNGIHFEALEGEKSPFEE